MMNVIKLLFLSGIIFSATTTNAFAFNFGFVRVPDWMDNYLIGLFLVQLPFWIGILVTKPVGVPFSQLYRTKMEPLPNFLFRASQILFFVLLAAVFVGMGLARV